MLLPWIFPEKPAVVVFSDSKRPVHVNSTIVVSCATPTRASPVMKTQGEIEAAICQGISRFEQDYMGRGPKGIHAHLIDDLLLVRLQGVLTAAEQQLAKSLPTEKGRDLLKQVRTQLVETARPQMVAMVEQVTGVKVISLHHDVSTVTAEEIVVFTLADCPPTETCGDRRPVLPGREPSFPDEIRRPVFRHLGYVCFQESLSLWRDRDGYFDATSS